MDKILVVDDDKDVVDSIADYFSREGFDVIPAYDGKQAMAIAGTAALDAVVLDVMLPEIDGLNLCEQLKAKSGVPVIFISALSGYNDRISGLLAGGDDYVCKPYSLQELALRVRKRIDARRGEKLFRTFEYGKLCVDTGARTVRYGGETASFTPLEFDILTVLVAHPNRVFSYDLLFDTVWQAPIFKSRHNIQVHVASLRKKIKALSGGKELIKTVSHKGYVFIPEEEQ